MMAKCDADCAIHQPLDQVSRVSRAKPSRAMEFEFVTSTTPGEFLQPKHRRHIYSRAMRFHLAKKDSIKVRDKAGRWIKQQPGAKDQSDHPAAGQVAVHSGIQVVGQPYDDAATTEPLTLPAAPLHDRSSPLPGSFLNGRQFEYRPGNRRSCPVTSENKQALPRRILWDGLDQPAPVDIRFRHPHVLETDLSTDSSSVNFQLHSVIGSNLDPFDAIPYLKLGASGIRFDELQHACLVRGDGGAVTQTQWFSSLVRTDPLANTIGQFPRAIHNALRFGECEGSKVLSLKGAALQALQNNLRSDTECYGDLTLVAIASLLCYEAFRGDFVALESHRQGMNSIIRRRGGVLDHAIDFEIACLLVCKFMESSIVLNQRPPSHYYQFCKSASQSPYARDRPPWPESPLFCPTGTLADLKHNRLCTSEICDILEDTYRLTRLVLKTPRDVDTIQSKARQLYEVVLARARRSATEPPARGASLRKHSGLRAIELATLLYAAALALRVPLPAAVPALARDLRLPAPLTTLSALCQQTDLGTLWGGYGPRATPSMTGVLHFVGLVGACAAQPPRAVLERQRDCASSRAVVPAYAMGERWLVTAALSPIVLVTTGYAEAYLAPLCTMGEICAWLRGEDPHSLHETREEEGAEGIAPLLPTPA